MNIDEVIKSEVYSSLKKIYPQINIEDIFVERIDDLSKGDYTTNIALRISKELKKSPLDIAKEIVEGISEIKGVEKVEYVQPGFVNFHLSDQYLLQNLSKIIDQGSEYFRNETKKGSDIVIEYTDPNPFKPMHLGHLYTNVIGEALVRLNESLGANVKRAIYQGDVGLHVAKTLWGMQELFKRDSINFSDLEAKTLTERISYIGEAYVYGTEQYDEVQKEDVIKEIEDINYYIFSKYIFSIEKKDFSKYEDINLWEQYTKSRLWCLEDFENMYKRMGMKDFQGKSFDYYFFESEMSEEGLNIVNENKGKVFEEDSGAVIYKGDESKDLHTRVFVNKYGLPTYEAKELALVFAKEKKIQYEESYIITGSEQKQYFEVVLDAVSKIDKDLASKTHHIPHALVVSPQGSKISSRKGGFTAVTLLDAIKEKVKEVMKETDEDAEDIADKVAISALKYAYLKVSIGKNVTFDFNQATSFDGDTGPYLLYTYARCNSILKNSEKEVEGSVCIGQCVSNSVIKELLRRIVSLKQSLLISAQKLSPSILCTDLFELAQTFNRFYQEVNVLDADDDTKSFLLGIVSATKEALYTGLSTLGIETVEQM